MRVGISGTGRIGRLLIRKAFSEENLGFEITVVNTTVSIPNLLHLLKYDSIHGTWKAELKDAGDGIQINGRYVKIISERDPERIPWSDLGVKLVIDATGKFNDRKGAEKHLNAGAEKVVITAPGKNMDVTVVMGVNEGKYDPANHRLLSTASCTTNCISPVLHVLDQAFGVKQGWMTTVHAFTNDQNHMDNSHKDLRRARACTSSMIPTSTGVSSALRDVLPHLADHIQGISVRVPVQDVSLLDLQVQVSREITDDDVRKAFREASNGSIGRFVGYNELPLVSADYIGSEQSAIVDGLSIMTRGDQVKLLAWYDNEWAYTCRVVDFIDYVVGNEPANQGGKEVWAKQSV